LFLLIWIIFNFVKNKKRKLNFTIIGPNFLILFQVQSGLVTDKSKKLRIAIEELVKNENLTSQSIKI
tara:strand:+ start:131 stop:331 length:201 start_codon:yes stop_codon:yes gene_type:complete